MFLSLLMKTSFLKYVSRTALVVVSLSVSWPGRITAQPQYTGPLVYNTNQAGFSSILAVEASAWLAAPFRTGADAAQLTSVTLFEQSFMITSGSFWVSIYGDNNGVPGSVLAGGLLNGNSHPNSWAIYTYTATQPLLLAPNAEYWAVASSDDTSVTYNYGWGWTANTNYTLAVGWSLLPEAAGSQDGGASWHTFSLSGQPGPLFLAVSGAIVPEPSATVLAMPGLAAPLLGFLRSRKITTGL